MALFVLLLLQFLLVRQAWEARNQEFDLQMAERMDRIRDDLEKAHYCFELYTEFDIPPREGMLLLSGNTAKDTVRTFHFLDTAIAREYPAYPDFTFRYDVPVHARVQYSFSFLGSRDFPAVSGDTGVAWVDEAYKHTLRDLQSGFRVVDTMVLSRVVHRVLGPILDSAEFGLQVSRHSDDSLVYEIQPARARAGDTYTAHLYTRAPFPESYDLHVTLYGKTFILLQQVGYLVAGLLLAVFSIAILFTQFSRMLWRQAKLAESKNEFVNNMTHEFKTPIANIRLALDTLSRRLNGQNQHTDILSVIEEENNRMNGNIDLILQTSSMTSGHIYYQRDVYPLDRLVQEAVACYTRQLEGKGQMRLQLGSNASVNVDRQHFTNALRTVVDNALKYSGDTAPDIRITTSRENDTVSVSVEDRGIGMTAYEQNRIFEKFYRVSHGNRHDIKGFGLGLFYARQVVSDLEGKICVMSQKGRGSTFTFHFPVAAAVSQ